MSALSFDLVNKRIRFQTLAPAVLGLTITGRLVGFLDPASARKIDDIYAKHAQVYPYLNNNTPDNATEYNYLKLELDGTGAEIVIGSTWINLDSITVMSSTKAVVEISNIAASDESKLRSALLSNGFTDFTIKFRDGQS